MREGRLGFILAPTASLVGGVLLASGLGLIHADPALLILSLGGATTLTAALFTLNKVLERRREYLIYEIEVEDVKLASRRLRVLGEVLQAIGRVYGQTGMLHACGRRGCSLILILPNKEDVEGIVRGLLTGFKVYRHVVNDPSAITSFLRGGRGEPLTEAIIQSTESVSTHILTQGEILIGYSEDGAAVFASIEEFWRHAGVFGTTGSGKTTTTAFITTQLARHVRVLVFDWHGEYEALYQKLGASNAHFIEPPRLPLIPQDLDLEVAVDVLEDTFDLTRHQSMLLYQALKSMNRREALPSDINKFIDSLLATIEVQTTIPSRAELEIRAALERRLRSLLTGEGEKYFSVMGDVKLPAEKGLYVIKVYKIMLLPLRRTYVRMLLAYLFYKALAENHILNTIIVLEEAQNIASTDTRTIPAILAEARKRKLGLIIVSQSPSSLHPSIMKNTNIRIVHTLKSAQDINVVAKSMSMPQQLREKLPKLPVGTAIVDTPQLQTPTLVKIPVGSGNNQL